MKIRSQIVLAQTPSVIMILCIILLFIVSLTSIEHQVQSILFDNFKSILSMQRLSDAFEELNDYIETKPKSIDDKIKNLENKVEKELFFQEKSIDQPAEVEELAQSLRKTWDTYKEHVISLSFDSNIEKEYRELKQVIADIIGVNQDAIVRKKDNLSNFIKDYRLLLALASVFSLVFGFLMSWVFTGIFLRPLNKMAETMSQFGKTDKTVVLDIKGSEEIEELSEEFKLMTNRLEEYHQSSLGHALKDYENLKTAFDALPYAVIIFNIKNEIVFMNKAALFLFDIKKSRHGKSIPLFHLNRSVKESLLKITDWVQQTHNPYIPEKSTEPIPVIRKKEKDLFVPMAYPIKNWRNGHYLSSKGVLMLLQDVKLRSASERETEQILKTFVHDIQSPLADIQMAIYTSLREEIGELTEKQKDILNGARDRAEEIESLYQALLKMFEMDKKGG